MLWRYHLISTRIAFNNADLLIVDGGIVEADDLGEARLKVSKLLTDIVVMGKPTNPDSVRILDQSGREVWRSKL
jgi:hypothetical protein